MPAARHDLLATANDAAARHGTNAITDRTLRDWVDEGLLEPAKAQGTSLSTKQVWLYSDDARLVVERIMIIRSKGARRVSQLAANLWVFHQLKDIDFVKRSLQSEFRRMRKQQERQFPWNYDHRTNSTLSEKEREKYAKQLPELDSDLAAAGFKLPADIMMPTASLFYWGEINKEKTAQIIANALSYFIKIPSEKLAQLSNSINIGAALGNPDYVENSGEDILEKISAEDLETARSLIWFSLMALMAGELLFSAFGFIPSNKLTVAYRKAARSIMTPDWIIMSLGLFAIAAFRLRMVNKPIK